MKKYITSILLATLLAPLITFAINVTVPQSTRDGDMLIGKLNGNYSATSTGSGNIGSLLFSTTTTPLTNAEGLMQWNSTDGTLDLGMQAGTITQQIGQELFIKVRNNTGVTITNGSPVYFSGRIGNRPKIALARGNATTTSEVMGLTTEDILDNADGYITTFGYVRGIKTNYTGWVTGNSLYVGTTTAGTLTNIMPSAPHHSDIIGSIGIVGGAGVGSIFISIDRHKMLDTLSDVDGTPLTTTGQFPMWNQARSVFDFYNVYTESASSTGWIRNNNNIYTASTNYMVGIGTISPTNKLTVQGTGTPVVIQHNDNNTSLTLYNYKAITAGDVSGIDFAHFNGEPSNVQSRIRNVVTNSGFEDNSSQLVFSTNLGSTLIDAMYISSGFVGIGTSPSNSLDVLGSTGDPSLTPAVNNQIGRFGAINFKLDIGTGANNTSWIQSRDIRAGGTNNPISLNPLGGNVGIGTTTPSATLNVVGLANTGYGQIKLASNTSVTGLSFADTSASSADRQWSILNNFTQAGNLDFRVSTVQGGAPSQTILSITSAGNIGVGTTSPLAKLSVVGTGLTTGVTFQTSNSASTPTMTVLDSGNVGIGTITPATPLDFNGSTGSKISYGGTSYKMGLDAPGMMFFDSLSNMDFRISAVSKIRIVGDNVGIGTSTPFAKLSVQGTYGSTLPLFSIASTTSAGFATSSIFTVLANGNVGIGTTTPALALNVYGSGGGVGVNDASGAMRMVTSSGINYIQSGTAFSSSVADLRFTSMFGGTTWMNIQGSTGNVGIGTTTPGYPLTVAGNVQFMGTTNKIETSLSTNSTAMTVTGYDGGGTGEGPVMWKNLSGKQLGTLGGDTAGVGNVYLLGNTDSTGSGMGGFSFINPAVAAGDKRVALIDARRGTNQQSASLNFFVWNSGTYNQAMLIDQTGGVAIGTAGTAAATKFQVVGTTTSTQIKITSGSSYGGQAVCYMADGSLGHQTSAQLATLTCVQN